MAFGHQGEDLPLPFGEFVEGPRYPAAAQQLADDGGVDDALACTHPLQRIGQELVIAHPAISREFGMAHMETRIGLSRIEALRNMGGRTGNAAIKSLASMLIQTERFGTSVAQALRVQSDPLRTERRQRAEEQAAKTTIKMVPPLVIFVLPSIIFVTIGPAVISLIRQLGPASGR